MASYWILLKAYRDKDTRLLIYECRISSETLNIKIMRISGAVVLINMLCKFCPWIFKMCFGLLSWSSSRKEPDTASTSLVFFYVWLTLHLSTILGSDQLDTQLLYFTIRLLWSSTCFEHYMLIIRRLNCIDAASGIVTISKWLFGAPESHLLRVTIPDAASIQFSLLMMSI